MAHDKKTPSIFDKKTCSICIHENVCDAFKRVSGVITDYSQFTTRLKNVNAIYYSMAEMCKAYKRLPAFDKEGI